jgi:hypothetical protein
VDLYADSIPVQIRLKIKFQFKCIYCNYLDIRPILQYPTRNFEENTAHQLAVWSANLGTLKSNVQKVYVTMKVTVINRDITYARKPIQYLPNFVKMTNSPKSFFYYGKIKIPPNATNTVQKLQ